MDDSDIFNTDIIKRQQSRSRRQGSRLIRNIYKYLIRFFHQSHSTVRNGLPVLSCLFKILVQITVVVSVQRMDHLRNAVFDLH